MSPEELYMKKQLTAFFIECFNTLLCPYSEGSNKENNSSYSTGFTTTPRRNYLGAQPRCSNPWGHSNGVVHSENFTHDFGYYRSFLLGSLETSYSNGVPGVYFGEILLLPCQLN